MYTSLHKKKLFYNNSIKDDREVVIKQTMIYGNETQINRIKWHYFINRKSDSIQDLDIRMLYPQKLDAYLSILGFKIINKFSWFKEEIFENKSEKQILVCKKNNDSR